MKIPKKEKKKEKEIKDKNGKREGSNPVIGNTKNL